MLHLDCHAEAFRHKKRTPQFCGVLLYKLLKSLISAVLFLFLRTSGNQSFTGSISFVFSKVLDESVSQIFCFCFPFGSISVCVTWVQDSWINAWQFCRNFEVEVWNCLCRCILIAPFRIASMIPRVSLMEIRLPVPFHPVFNRYAFAPLFSIFLTSSSAYFVGCSSRNAWPKQAENVGVGSVIPRSVPASLAVKPDRK